MARAPARGAIAMKIVFVDENEPSIETPTAGKAIMGIVVDDVLYPWHRIEKIVGWAEKFS